jgi:hypothetical protein
MRSNPIPITVSILTLSTDAQHADPLPKPVFCVHCVAASDPRPGIDPPPLSPPLSESTFAPTEPVVAPTEPPWSPPSSTCCATCIPFISPAVDPPPPPTVDPAKLVSILDDQDTDVTWQISNLTNAQYVSTPFTVSVTCTSALWGHPACLSPPGSITIRSALRPRFTKPTSLPLLPARLVNAIKVFAWALVLSCNIPTIAVACMAKRFT